MAYAPAANATQSASLAHQAGVIYYQKRALDRLTPVFRFYQAGEPHPMPQKSGKIMQFHRFNLPGANLVPSAEGVIGNPFSLASSTLQAALEQFSDFTSSSTLLELTDINESTLQRMVDDVSFRAALSTDTMIRNEVDSNSGAVVSPNGAYFTASDCKFQVSRMEGQNIKPKMGNTWLGICHPFIKYDLINDNTAGGFIDVMKYQSGTQVLNGEIGEVGGVRWLTTTNVGLTGSAPVLYHTYIFGEGGLGIVDLQGRGPDGVVDPQKERFKLNIVQGGPSAADPEGQIGTYVSYYFVFTTVTLDTTNYRFRIIQAAASGL